MEGQAAASTGGFLRWRNWANGPYGPFLPCKLLIQMASNRSRALIWAFEHLSRGVYIAQIVAARSPTRLWAQQAESLSRMAPRATEAAGDPCRDRPWRQKPRWGRSFVCDRLRRGFWKGDENPRNGRLNPGCIQQVSAGVSTVRHVFDLGGKHSCLPRRDSSRRSACEKPLLGHRAAARDHSRQRRVPRQAESRRHICRLVKCKALPAQFLSLVILLPHLALGQSAPTATQWAFETAEVHRSAPATRERGGFLPEGFECRGVTMLKLIATAYSVNTDLVLGGPDWLGSDRFDIAAKAPRGLASPAALLGMLQALLADRFGLAVHDERRDMPVYLLAVG